MMDQVAKKDSGPVGIDNLLSVAHLPFLRDGVQVHYEGSIDKQGGNADWDWWLYQDNRGEWVLFDVDGPGCIHNFVQHRYPTCEAPTFRFYFDGEPEPRFVIKPEEFGSKFPFIAPLAGIFEGDDVSPSGRGPIWVVRSFVPMPYARSCRITSSVKLEGFDRAKGHGGWGHVMYHSYASAGGVRTFTGKEDYSQLLKLWSSVGADPKAAASNQQLEGSCDIAAGGSAVLLDQAGEGSIAAIRLKVNAFARPRLHDLWIRLTWDDDVKPAVLCPLGALFGNEIGLRSIRYLMHGMTVAGSFYCYWPMPFWKSARVELLNRSDAPVTVDFDLQITPASVRSYPRAACGYFRASPYFPPTPATPTCDTPLAVLSGRGHVVSAIISGWSVDNKYVSCEGDVRVYIDDIATPQVQSDGSESYACYGWGFVAPGQQNPVSGYDGLGHPTYAFSESRLCLGDWYPFQTGLRFGIEAGDRNDCDMSHSGLLLYYGQDKPALVQTDLLAVGDQASREAHDYHVVGLVSAVELESLYETDDSTPPVKDCGQSLGGASEFTVKIDPRNNGVRLRRRSDQQHGRQRACVYVDGVLVTERAWYWAGNNPYRRWLEDEFEVPLAYTRGKSQLRLRIQSLSDDGAPQWSQYRYWVFSHVDPASMPPAREPTRAT